MASNLQSLLKCVAVALALSGCARIEEAKLVRRPADAPDVFVLVVSGHCLPIMGLCDGNFNPEYMSHAGTPDALATALTDADHDVRTGAYVDGWYTWVDTEDVVLAAGFLDLVATLQLVNDAWMRGFSNPTRLVLVGHGHGVVWTHLAAYAAPSVPIEVLVDLDGHSSGWDDDEGYFGVGDDWPAFIPGYVEADEQTWTIDAWIAADSWSVSGVPDSQDIEDVVAPTAVLNLEVQSTPDVFQQEYEVFDGDANHRPDGGTKGIRTFTSTGDHYSVYEPGSDSMNWVIEEILGSL